VLLSAPSSLHQPAVYQVKQYWPTVSFQGREETFGITGISEAMFSACVLNVLGGLLALEIDSILVDFDRNDVNVNCNLVIEGLSSGRQAKTGTE